MQAVDGKFASAPLRDGECDADSASEMLAITIPKRLAVLVFQTAS